MAISFCRNKHDAPLSDGEMRAVVVLLIVVVVAVAAGGATAAASCARKTYFVPSSGSRIPPGATVYAFPEFDTDVVVRVIGDGREVHAFTYHVEAGSIPAVAVELEHEGLRSVTIEVSWIGSKEYPLGSATYAIDESISEPPAGLAIQSIARTRSEGLPACVSHDLLFFDLDVRAPAYRFEWARSERAYRDGDRHVSIVKRAEHIDGNVFAVGNSGCGQNVIPMLWRETTLFVGVAPVGYTGPQAYAVPVEPTRIDLDELSKESWETHFGSRLVESTPAPEPVLQQLERAAVTSTHPGRIALGGFLGLLLGWPIGLAVGRRIFKRRRQRAS